MCRLFYWLLAVFLTNETVCGQLVWSLFYNSRNDTANKPSGRVDHALGYHQGQQKIILFGGRNGNGILGDTWIFNIQTSELRYTLLIMESSVFIFNVGNWRQISTNGAPAARFTIVGGVLGDNFYIATGEGEGKKFFNDIWRFDIK